MLIILAYISKRENLSWGNNLIEEPSLYANVPSSIFVVIIKENPKVQSMRNVLIIVQLHSEIMWPSELVNRKVASKYWNKLTV